MKKRTILFDIIHPANVHYFKNIINNLKSLNITVIITARSKEITYELLRLEDIPYIPMGKNPKSSVGKILFLLWCEIKMFFIFLRYRPDICLSFGASYVAHNCFLFRKVHIALDDTEHASLNRKLYLPFTDLVLTPKSYQVNLGKKHIRFPGHMELFYLNRKYFKPDKSIYDLLNIDFSEKFVFFRFVSWSALHDTGQSGLSKKFKIDLVNELSKNFKIFISSEGLLPKEIEKFKINVPPHLIHHVLYFADLFIGEGATMASECAALGTPAIYVNTLNAGTLEEQANLGLIYSFRNESGVVEKIKELISKRNHKSEINAILTKLDKERIDLPEFLTWLILNYPESKKIVQTEQFWEQKFKN